jgi:hypothetical protein
VSYSNVTSTQNVDDGFSLHDSCSANITNYFANNNNTCINNISNSTLVANSITCSNNNYGVQLQFSGVGGATITNATFTSNTYNIRLEDTQSLTLTNASISGGSYGLSASTTGAVTLSNITITNSTTGLYVENATSNISVSGLTLTGGGTGVKFSSSKGTVNISNSTISNQVFYGVQALNIGNGVTLTGVEISGSGYNAVYLSNASINITKSKLHHISSNIVDILTGTLTVSNSLFYNAGSGNNAMVVRYDNSVAVIKNCVFYNNAYGIYVHGSTQLYNTILANNATAAVWFAGAGYANSLTLSNNDFWSNTANFTGATKENTNGIALNPRFTNAAGGDFSIATSTSPVIDAGTDVSLTTDYLGNHIYGTPDIGPYEYQPPYTIGTDRVNTSAGIRIYADGKYRYTVATSSATTANISITPSGGWGSSDYSQWMDVSIDTWNTTNTYYKKWTESSASSTINTTHVIGDLLPNRYYQVKVGSTALENLQANASGTISFTYSGGYSTKTFEVGEVPAAPTITSPTVLSSSTIRWNFTDNADNETGFRVYTNADAIATSSATVNLTYLDETGLSENTQYTRYVKAYNSYGESASSSATSTYTLTDTPTNLTATQITTTSVTLSVDSFPNATSGVSGYYFANTTKGTNSGWIQTNSWEETGIEPNTSYTYTVKYRNGDSVETATATTTQYTLIQTPASISFDNIGVSSITVSASGTLSNLASSTSGVYFNETSGNSGGSDSSWQQIASYQDTGLSENTQYTYRVKARNGDGTSTSYTATSSKYTLANIPTGLTTINTADQSITLSVDTFPNATSGSSGYYFSQGSHNSGWIQANSWQDTGLACGTNYTYSVIYRNGNGAETSAISQTFRTPNCSGAIIIFPQTEQQPIQPQTNIPTVTFEKPISQMTRDELLAKIAEITQAISQIKSLMSNNQLSNPPSNIPTAFFFTTNLKQGVINIAVKYLQMLLNQGKDTQLAESGVGSLGNETTYFGPKTTQAVIKFQEKYKDEILKPLGFISGTGFVGKTTRDKLNELLGK